jgi:c-di-GMP-binding flagellar brake protein YcgR
MPAPSNRRSYFRLPIQIPINLRVSGIKVPVPSTLVDISGGGCQVHGRTAIKEGSPVEFDLPRPGEPPLRLPGTVRKVIYTPGDKIFRYAIEFPAISPSTHDNLLRFIAEEQRREIARKRGHELSGKLSNRPSREHRSHTRVDIELPIRYNLVGAPTQFSAIAIDISTGGMRILTERVLRQEWTITVRFTLPNDPAKEVLKRRGHDPREHKDFMELRMDAKALPGLKESRGQYIQALIWVDPDPVATDEIQRFVNLVRQLPRR